ncbi:CLUMA_CG010006, isoform A [Clunio marinus]|uniref:small monomeric GTPase n=1 Tax=Clunio marinus TaxID=568069 RepID=A0A1J1I896_9DIPT|nr:CLUMA_CG010006, isoform A [Clunio marinus]
MMNSHIKLKILVIGESGVGKSSLMLRFTDDKFDANEQPTIGVDFKVKHLELDGEKIYLQIWDTAGQERFRTLIPSYYRDATGAILVYDVTKTSSFQKLETWLEELETNTNQNITKMIVGNKIDLKDERRVDREMGKKFAKQQRALFVETSAASNINVQMAFEELVKKILEDNIFDDRNGVLRSNIRLSGAQGQEDNNQASGGSCGGYCGRYKSNPFKILVVGDSGVGKSCLMLRFTTENFNFTPEATIAADVRVKTVEIEGKTIFLQLWDTAGQERFRAMNASFYRGAHGVILVYDVTRTSSFQSLNSWIEDIQNYSSNPTIMIVGNKIDQPDLRAVQRRDGKKFADSKQMLFAETSAANDINVDLIFEEVAKKILATNSTDNSNYERRAPNISLHSTPTNPPMYVNCCNNVKFVLKWPFSK